MNFFEVISGIFGGASNLGNLVIGIPVVLLIFAVSQVILFGQIWLIWKGYVIIKEFLEKTDIIPRAKKFFN